MTSTDSLPLMIKNLTNAAIRVNSSRSSSIVQLTVVDNNGKEAMPLLLIHDLGAGTNDFIDVAPNDSAVVNYHKPLGKRFQIFNNARYTLQMRYDGIVWQDNKKTKYKRTFSDTVLIR